MSRSLRVVRFSAAGFLMVGWLGWMTYPLQAKKTAPGVPDLTIDEARVAESAFTETQVFLDTDCAVVEGCVNGAGERLLLRFDVATPNIGTADLVLGMPKKSPDLFEYSPCHGHYHFSGYAKYELLSLSEVVVEGRKQAFCLEDFEKVDPNAGKAKYTCSNQGISVGWQDVYRSSLDCQWLDITGVPPGMYELRVTINPERVLTEASYENNTASVFLVLYADGTIDVLP